MNLSDFQQSYHKLLVFHMDVIKVSHLIWRGKLSPNQIDLLLSAIGIILNRLFKLKKGLEERKSDSDAEKNEQTLFEEII